MKKIALIILTAACLCACNNEPLNNKIMGVWALAGTDNASFVIENDSIYYPESFTTYKYLLVKDSIKIEYEGNAESFLVKTKGPDTLILKGAEEQVYYRFHNPPLNTEAGTPACDSLLMQLIKGSSFDPKTIDLVSTIVVDTVESGVAKLQLLAHNVERDDDVVFGWLEMDINKNQLRDVTIDPDNPVQLNFNTKLFQQVAASCTFSKK